MARIRKFNPKWLVISFIVACVIGGSVGVYFNFDKPAPTATIQKPPVQPTPVPPVVSTPTQPENPTPKKNLEVTWKTNGPTDTGGLLAVVVNDNEGKIIYAIGLLPGQFRPDYVWKSSDGGNSWSFLGQFTNPEINFKGKEQIYNNYLNVPVFSGPFFASKRDPNNESIVLRAVQLTIIPTEYAPIPPLWEFHLSLDNGKSWLALNLPPGWKPEGNIILTDDYHFDLISSDGTLKLFLAAGKVWQAEISLPR